MKPLPDPFCTNDRSVVPSKSKARLLRRVSPRKPSACQDQLEHCMGENDHASSPLAGPPVHKFQGVRLTTFLSYRLEVLLPCPWALKNTESIACFHPLEVCFHCMPGPASGFKQNSEKRPSWTRLESFKRDAGIRGICSKPPSRRCTGICSQMAPDHTMCSWLLIFKCMANPPTRVGV